MKEGRISSERKFCASHWKSSKGLTKYHTCPQRRNSHTMVHYRCAYLFAYDPLICCLCYLGPRRTIDPNPNVRIALFGWLFSQNVSSIVQLSFGGDTSHIITHGWITNRTCGLIPVGPIEIYRICELLIYSYMTSIGYPLHNVWKSFVMKMCWKIPQMTRFPYPMHYLTEGQAGMTTHRLTATWHHWNVL